MDTDDQRRKELGGLVAAVCTVAIFGLPLLLCVVSAVSDTIINDKICLKLYQFDTCKYQECRSKPIDENINLIKDISK